MKYLRVFENDADYQTFNSGEDFVIPNICFIKTEEKIAFKQEEFPYNMTLTHGQKDDVSLNFYNWGFDNCVSTIFGIDIDKYNITIVYKEGFSGKAIRCYINDSFLVFNTDNQTDFAHIAISKDGLCTFVHNND